MKSKICLNCGMYESRIVLDGVRVGCKCAEPQLLTIHDLQLPAPEMDNRAVGLFQAERGRAITQLVLKGEMEWNSKMALMIMLECMGYFHQTVEAIIQGIEAEGLALRNSGPMNGSQHDAKVLEAIRQELQGYFSDPFAAKAVA